MSDIWMDDHQKIGVLSCRTVTGIYAPHFFQMHLKENPEEEEYFDFREKESNHDPRTL